MKLHGSEVVSGPQYFEICSHTQLRLPCAAPPAGDIIYGRIIGSVQSRIRVKRCTHSRAQAMCGPAPHGRSVGFTPGQKGAGWAALAPLSVGTLSDTCNSSKR